jgi:hypothetical protein
VVAQRENQVDNANQQQPAPVSELAGYTSVADWLDRHAGPFFETRSSIDWFIRAHRRELIEDGALIPREGRSGSLISIERFPRAVIAILRRRALGRVKPATEQAAA